MSGGSKTSSRVKPWRQATPYMGDILGIGQDLYQSQQPITPEMQAGIDQQMGYWGGSGVQDMIGQAQGGWGQMLNPFGEGSPLAQAQQGALGLANSQGNPYAQQLMDMTRQQATDAFQQGVMPSINQGAVGAGGFGGSRQGVAQGMAANDFMKNLNNQQTALASDLYGQNIGAQSAGINALTGIAQTGLGSIGNAVSGAGQALGLGGMPGQMQLGLGQQQQQLPWQHLQNYQGVVSPFSGLQAVSSSSGPGFGQQLLGAGVSALPFLMMSDENLKDNIRPIENAVDKLLKLRGVSWNWKEDGTPALGVVAQEVEKVLKEAVVDAAKGRAVDYGQLVGLAIQAIHEIQGQIEALEDKMMEGA